MPDFIDDQVYIDDINEQEEMALDCWKVNYNFFQRLQHQGAPQELLAKLLDVINGFQSAYSNLKEIRACFPPRDGVPE